MQRYEAQKTLFDSRPSRMSLLALDFQIESYSNTTEVNVWRNHSFEPLQSLIAYYAAFRSWNLSFRLSSYDDSFSFNGIQGASLELLWMDSGRILANIDFSEWLEWLQERLATLRELSSAPIILATWLADPTQHKALGAILERFTDIYLADMSEACRNAGIAMLDTRSASLAGTPLSGAAQVILARNLACKWIAGATLPPIKALALDLDNTLHLGVLGEDGIEDVLLSADHKRLQHYIKKLKERGIFLALVSRNEQSDVENLFSSRRDYPLCWDDFSAIEVSWGEKADALQRIAKKLRISTDAILFVDDNPGELVAATQQHRNLQTLYANPNADLTRIAIKYYPGLWRWKQEADDGKRIADLKASNERESLALKHNDPSEYFRSLHITLKYFWDSRSQLGRLADLCRKTNQFNLALRRLTETELFDCMSNPYACVASVQLCDRLSDSGIIACIVAELIGSQLRVQELCISCRAIGRNLENDIILYALRSMSIWNDSESVQFRVRQGERNRPAIDWLNHLPREALLSSNNEMHIMSSSALGKVPLIPEVIRISEES